MTTTKQLRIGSELPTTYKIENTVSACLQPCGRKKDKISMTAVSIISVFVCCHFSQPVGLFTASLLVIFAQVSAAFSLDLCLWMPFKLSRRPSWVDTRPVVNEIQLYIITSLQVAWYCVYGGTGTLIEQLPNRRWCRMVQFVENSADLSLVPLKDTDMILYRTYPLHSGHWSPYIYNPLN